MPDIFSCADLARSLYGIDVGFEESAAGAVANIADAVMIRNGPNRIALVIVNASANILYARPDAPASAARGIIIPANGGTFILGFRDDLTLPAHEWHIAAAADGSAYYYQALNIIGKSFAGAPAGVAP
jgi:hypothetical protein